MLKLFSVSILLLLCSCVTVNTGVTDSPQATSQAVTSPNRAMERSTKGLTYKLGMDPGNLADYCSATAVGPAALITAEHCTAHISGDIVLLNGHEARVRDVITDNMDHAIIIFAESQFDRYAVIAKLPIVGDEVFMWGNSLFDSFLRRGYVCTFVWNQPFMDIPVGSGWMVMDMQVSGGDSGSGIFNKRGQLIAVLTGYSRSASSVYATSMPFNFDKAKIRAHVNSKHLSPR